MAFQMRLNRSRAFCDLNPLDAEQKIEHENAVHLSNRLYFHFWQTRKRFLRKEIRRDQCIDLVNELVEDWAREAGLDPRADRLTTRGQDNGY